MKVLIRNEWQGGFLDYHRPHNAYRIEVRAWRDLERLRGLRLLREEGQGRYRLNDKALG